MRNLNYQLKQLCQRNRDGSFGTQRDRARVLTLIANQLHELGFFGMTTGSLKPKHVDALVRQWRDEALSAGTIKNRMAALRWWAEKVDRANVIMRSNADYGIPERVSTDGRSKAKFLEPGNLDRILVSDCVRRTNCAVNCRELWSLVGHVVGGLFHWIDDQSDAVPTRPRMCPRAGLQEAIVEPGLVYADDAPHVPIGPSHLVGGVPLG